MASTKTISTLVLALAGTLGGCESTDDANKDDGGAPPAGAVLILDANNYSSTSALTPPTIDTAPGADLDISWDDLTVDMQCHEMDPSADIGKVALLRFTGLTKQQVAEKLTSDELKMNELAGYTQFDTKGATSCSLFDLTNFGTAIDYTEQYVEDPDKVYVMLWASGEEPGTGARAMAFLNPTSSSVNTEVVAENACDPATGEGILVFDAEFQAPLAIPAGKTTVNWGDVETNGLGKDADLNSIDRILLGFYADTDPATLESQIFDIDRIATDLWEIVDFSGGRTIDLKALQHREANGDFGDYFAGFDGYPEGTWLLGLQCSFCQNPSPIILTVVVPE